MPRLRTHHPRRVAAGLCAAALGALLAGAVAAPPAGAAAAIAAAKAKPPARTARRVPAASADTILARLPNKVITTRQFLRAWATIDPRFRPPGTDMAAKRKFLEQLIQKELLARAADAEPFTMASLESAQFVTYQRDLLRRALLKRLVSDSARVDQADLDSARARVAAASRLSADELREAARPFAERRRAAEVDEHIRAEIAPAWDDSAAAMLVRAYAKLDSTMPDPSKPFSLRLPDRTPALSPADSARVVVRTSMGELTAHEYARRFLAFDPFKVPLPRSVEELENLGAQILGGMWVDRACQDPRIQNDPDVVAALAERRESIALDHYYGRHISSVPPDTSESALRARYARTPNAYATPAHWVVTRLNFATQAAADSAQKALAAGAPWDSICAHALAGDPRFKDCLSQINLPDPYPDTIFTTVLAGLKPGESSVLPMPEATPGDERRLLVRLVGHVDRRFQTFDEARPYVLRDASEESAEKALDAEIARLRALAHVTTNERALARIDLAAWARQVRPAPAPPR